MNHLPKYMKKISSRTLAVYWNFVVKFGRLLPFRRHHFFQGLFACIIMSARVTTINWR